MHVVKAILPLSMSYLLYMVMGMTALRGVNLPMYTTLRVRRTPPRTDPASCFFDEGAMREACGSLV
jgi:hypothetical protein